MEAWNGDGPDRSDYDAAPDNSVTTTENSIEKKLRAIADDTLKNGNENSFAFDRTLLEKHAPLTQAEIDYVNLQLTDAVRKLATAYGCAEEDVAKLQAHYWHEKKCSYKDGSHVWGIFYDCEQSNFEDKDLPNPPRVMSHFMDDFEQALGAVNFHESNTVSLPEGGRQAVGWSQGGWRENHAIMRGGSRDVLLPIVRLVELLDPSFTLRFDVPQEYTSIYDGISAPELTSMANAPESAFWIDREWAQQELAQRASGQQWREMQARIDESRIAAQKEARPQSLRERLKIALSSSHIVAVEPQSLSGTKGR